MTDRDWLTVSVRDKGSGISPADQLRIFEKFYRAENAGDKKGYGLGLTISKMLIELHQGKVGVSSDDAGTTFWFSLPVDSF